MSNNHNPMTCDRAKELLNNAIPDMALRLVIDHMKTTYDVYTLIDMLLNRGFESSELIHDFGFIESYVNIVQRRSPTFGYTAYTPLGTVDARIPWADYMLHDDDNIMFLHGLTVKQFATLPVRPERNLNNILYQHFHNIGKTFKDLISLLKNTRITSLCFENIDIHSIDQNAISNGKTAVDMLSDYGIQSAYDMLMLEDDKINEIFRTDTNLAEHFRKQTINSIILLGTPVANVGTWSDDTASHLLARDVKHAYELYHNNRLGWLQHMPDSIRTEIQQNLDKFMQHINTMFASIEPTKENLDA